MEQKQTGPPTNNNQDETISVAPPLNPQSINGAQKADNQKAEPQNLISWEDSKSVTVFDENQSGNLLNQKKIGKD